MVDNFPEPVEERYRRDWLELQDDRKVRGFDLRSEERRDRVYADPETLETVSSTNDNSNGAYNDVKDNANYVPDRDGPHNEE